MRRTTSISLSSEEEAFMRRQMEIAGETELGPHIKRVYFGRLNPGEGVLAELRTNTDMTLSMLATMTKGLPAGAGRDRRAGMGAPARGASDPGGGARPQRGAAAPGR